MTVYSPPYHRKWKYLLIFTSGGKSISMISLGTILSILSHLFHTKSRNPSTISHNRTALAQPLLKACKLNVGIVKVTTLITFLKKEIPREASTKQYLDLKNILDQLETIYTAKRFFLLSATGWRISKLHECIRDIQFLEINKFQLNIKSHSIFVANNKGIN